MLARTLGFAFVFLAALAVSRPAQAAGAVALMPPYISTAAAGNGAAVDAAFRRSLERQGFQVLPASQVSEELRHLKIDPTKPQAIATLAKVRESLGVDYVVYPRILAVGQGAVSKEVQATILVNVAGTSKGSYLHTRQIAQKFSHSGPSTSGAVIPAGAADLAAAELLKGFYEKAK